MSCLPREEREGTENETRASADAWASTVSRCLATSKENHVSALGRRSFVASPSRALRLCYICCIGMLKAARACVVFTC